MGVFGNKGDIAALLAPYKEQVEMLKEHIGRLEKQNKALMEALVAAKSPEAYKEMKAEEAALANYQEMDPSERKHRELRHETQKRWIENIEQPTFNSFNDFEAFLQRRNPPTGQDVELEPLHGNTES